jgi:Lon protease-like protein
LGLTEADCSYGRRTILRIASVEHLDDGRLFIDAMGERRFRVLSRGERDGYNTATVEWFDDTDAEGADERHAEDFAELKDAVERGLLNGRQRTRVLRELEDIVGPMPDNVSSFTFWVASIISRMQSDQYGYNWLQQRSIASRVATLRRLFLQ